MTRRPERFAVAGSTTVADAGFLVLAEARVRGSEGESFTRFVVHHPGAVVVVPVAADHESVILVRQFRAATNRELLEVPAGKRDVHGEAPEANAERELVEEIGWRPRRLVKLCEFYNSPGFTDEYTYLYAAFDLVRLEAPASATVEEQAMTIEQVAMADIDRLIAAGTIVDAKSIIGLLLTRRHLAGEYAGFGA